MTVITAGTVTRVSVTREDIAKGEAQHCQQCPVALAIARAIPGAEVSVGNAHADLFPRPDVLFVADLPDAAKAFICRFDSPVGDTPEVAPFEFDLTWEATAL